MDGGRYWAFSGCRPDCCRRERERKESDGFFLLCSEQAAACDSGGHRDAGLILGDPQGWAGRSCCSQGPCNIDVEIRQAPGRGMTKGCLAGCRTSCPIESGKGGDGEGRMLENRFLRCQPVDSSSHSPLQHIPCYPS